MLLTLCLLLAGLPSQAQTPGPEGLVPDSTELRVLRQFYDATGGATWNNRTNWLTGTTLADAASWRGVRISQGDVVEITLLFNNLQGPIPVVLSALQGLQHLNLAHNNLRGSLPPVLGQLSRLQLLWIGANQLTGSIPPEYGQLRELTYLDLGANQLSGSIPAALGQLTKLNLLILSRNQLTGPVPAELGNLALLDHLSLHSNRLNDLLPASLSQLQVLTKLQLRNNLFTGEVPPGLAQLANLTLLSLEGNRLTRLPAWSSASALTALSVGSNYLSFGSLEPNFTGPGQPVRSGFTYQPQSPPPGTDTVRYVPGDTLRLACGLGGRRTRYQWERLVGGQWQTQTGATDSVLVVPAADSAAAGLYRTRRPMTGLRA